MKSQNGSVNGRNGECGMEMGICGDVSNGDGDLWGWGFVGMGICLRNELYSLGNCGPVTSLSMTCGRIMEYNYNQVDRKGNGKQKFNYHNNPLGFHNYHYESSQSQLSS
jgi:hypothetical protein